MTKPKILVGIPQPELTSHWFTDCLWRLLMHSGADIEMCRWNAVGSVIAHNRNRLVDEAKKYGATHLLQIDADSTFPPDALVRLLKHDKDIVGATTCDRAGQSSRPLCQPVDGITTVSVGQGPIPVKLIGMCFMLIKMEVFDKLRTPYYADPPRWMVDENLTGPEIMYEDEYFCHTAKKAGFEVLCDVELSMEIGHIGSKIYHIK